MEKRIEIKWMATPEAHDYPAALSYLCLIFDPRIATKFVERLRKAKSSTFKAKDVFRAGHR